MLITFEGPDGSGKSTAMAAIAERLRERGIDVFTTREPGAGMLGEQIRSILLDGPDIDPKAELLLFLADRANHVATIIRPALEQGKTVLCDRFTDSTIVYQGFAQGLNQDFIRKANHFSTGGLVPDFTILFDLEPHIGLARLGTPDRIDRQPLEFHQRIRVGFLKEAHSEPGRWIVLDASRPREHLVEEVLEVVMGRLGNKRA
jgi:dTMP kinase